MKKIIVLLLVLVLSCLAFASCEMIPDEVMDKLAPVLEKIGVDAGEKEPAEQPPAHEHNFVLSETVAATCKKSGKEVYTCECGETKTVELEKSTEHAYVFTKKVDPSCTAQGTETYTCSECEKIRIDKFGEPTGHNMGEFVEYSRMIVCTNTGCTHGYMPDGNGKYLEVIVYKAEEVESKIADYERIYGEIAAILEAADKYDPALHAFVKDSELYKTNKAMEEKYEELYDVLIFITGQYQIAQLEYYINLDTTSQENFNYIANARTEMVSKFYSFSGTIAESMYREYYYEGMTDAEIDEYVGESDAVSNPEYVALVQRNDEIESEYLRISSGSSEVPVMYAEFVANNKRIAELLGYDNYLEYAYKERYDRDYSYTEVKQIYEYVKEYIVPVYVKLYRSYGSDNSEYGNSSSFFKSTKQNKALNDYIDCLTIKGNKTVSFSDEFNALMGDGRCFTNGKAGTAYVTSLYGIDFDGSDLPIAYFSDGYANFFTVAHEFGHFMNETYSEGKYSQSYDLLEMHSQGNEMLFLAYLNNNTGLIDGKGLNYLNVYQPLNMFFAAVNAIAVDAFEQAVYLDYYDGHNAEEIMDFDEATGLYITADEYDILFSSIYSDMGVPTKYQRTSYWRGAVISSPCYYVSYSISALSVVQLLPMGREDFDAAADAYLKLFSYVDEYENGGDFMTTEEILHYAGLKSFTEEELYQEIYEYFMNN